MLCRYVGEILMNLLDGKWEFTWPNGDRHQHLNVPDNFIALSDNV
jgi:hypothetical protein